MALKDTQTIIVKMGAGMYIKVEQRISTKDE
jgi:hypothetical protein